MPLKLPSISRKALSIDFGSSGIKVIVGQASKKGISISKAFKIDMPKDAYSDGEIHDEFIIANELKRALKENKISTDWAYGIINSSSIITREIIIPKVPEKEIASIIGYQLGDYLPIKPDDYVVEHLILGEIDDMGIEKLNILLIAIPKNIVLEHLSLMKEIGLKPQVLDYQSNSIAKLINYNGLINNSYNTENMAIASIDIGYSNTKLTIVKNGTIRVTRILDIGAKRLCENLGSFFDHPLEELEQRLFEIEDINQISEEVTDYFRLVNLTKSTMDGLLSKIESVFNYYTSRKGGNEISLILLQGGLANINGLDNLFSKHFNILTKKLTTLDKIKWNGDLLKYSNAIGGLIRVDEVKR